MKPVLVCSLLIFGFINTAFAEEPGRFSIGASVGYLDPKQSLYKSAVYPTINIGWGINSECSVELTIGRGSNRR
jgi:hypothetical protein